MRKGIVLLLLLLFVLSTSAGAQVRIGLRAGMNLSTITGGLQNGFEKRIAIGPGGGLVVEAPFTEKISLQAELLVNSRGTAYKVKTSGIVEQGHLGLYYLDVPILVKGFLGTGEFRGYIATGPQLSCGLFLHNYYKLKGVGISERGSSAERFPELYNRFEMAWNLDVGLHLDLDNSSALEIGIRPVVGVTQVVKSEFTEQAPRNIMITLTAAYIFAGSGQSKPSHFIP